jgi:hypothetical protein
MKFPTSSALSLALVFVASLSLAGAAGAQANEHGMEMASEHADHGLPDAVDADHGPPEAADLADHGPPEMPDAGEHGASDNANHDDAGDLALRGGANEAPEASLANAGQATLDAAASPDAQQTRRSIAEESARCRTHRTSEAISRACDPG